MNQAVAQKWLPGALLGLVLILALLATWSERRPVPTPESPPVTTAFQSAASLESQPEGTSARQSYASQAQALRAQLLEQPGDREILRQLAWVLAASAPEEALPYLEQLAMLEPEEARDARALGDAIRTASYQEEPAYTFLTAGRALASLDEWELAAEAFSQAARLRPDWAEPLAFLGEAWQHIPAAKPEESLAALEAALELDPGSAPANTFMAFYWQRAGELSRALPFMETAIESDPNSAILRLELGNLQATLGNLADAQVAYEQAIDLDQDNPLYWRSLAEFCLGNGIHVRSVGLPAARQAVLLAPDDPASLDTLGQVFIGLEDYHSADKFLQRALDRDPTYLPAHLHLAQSALYQGNMETARQKLTWVAAQAPGSPVAQRANELILRYFP